MHKGIAAIMFAALLFAFAGQAEAGKLMGKGSVGPYDGEWCKVTNGSVSNRDGDVSFSVSAVCGDRKISGKLVDAEPVGDGKSIRYFGNLKINGKAAPAEAVLTSGDDGTASAAVAVDGIVFDAGKIIWEK